MNILCIGDISGRPGRQTVGALLPQIKREEKVDFVIANCENAAGGYGVTRAVLDELIGYGVDYFTSGDHVWKVREFVEEMHDSNLPILRPYNYEGQEQLPGRGWAVVDMGSRRLAIVNLLGQVFMHEPVRSPFWMIDRILEELAEAGIKENDPVIIDIHAEATAEKISLAYYVKDRVSGVFGTHTHVPTADQRIIGRAAYVTDAGMVGPLDASLWAGFDAVINNFKFPFKQGKVMEMGGRRVFNSVLITVENGRATAIKRVDRTLQE
ncbi:MAG: hypothetical protein TR69_WS6001000972 [candidate division WS6 bacterium OLB20]|uniref:Metallophosphoesterase n=1 Tax=candidate division WS6 bacterium OLB20 TaxID=1617426 RepID=A0A136LZ65_9BACT|nr:MAG: hypothetical protein TR69_WS6001000972 [candidate division WS6 bacterium OLB20]